MSLTVCQKFKPIFTSLSPNTERDDIFLALKLIFEPWSWKKGKAVLELEKEFKNYLGTKYAFSFNSARSAFLAILKALDLKSNDEVLLQGFTCNAVVNPLLWSNLKPVFVDIERETLNINPQDIERKISSKSKAVIVQHSFGLPANLDRIIEICKRKNLILIEDCAHSLGAEYSNKKIGSFSKAAFFSFGRDKVISSVYGGMAVTNDDRIAERIKSFQQECSLPSCPWIIRQLLHPVLTNYFIIPLYFFFEAGRWFLIFFQKTGILSKAVHEKEKRGEKPFYFPQKMPNALGVLALNQFRKLERFIFHQREIAEIFDLNLNEPGFSLPQNKEGRIYMRYPLLVKGETNDILKKARKRRIFLDDGWRKTIVTPPDTNQEKVGYKVGFCPVAEKVSQEIINLPTHINISRGLALRVINFLKGKL